MGNQIGGSGKRNRLVGGLGAVLGVLVVAAFLCPQTAEAKMTLKDKVGEKEIKLQIYGFSQFEARGGDGWQISKNNLDNGVDFQAQRIRVGFNYFHDGPVAGKLFLDFNQSHTSNEGGLPKMIKDAFVAYKFNDSAFIRLGMIKTPLGMTFTIPGWNLDIVERQGLDKGLVLERDFGVMLSGRLIGQAGYDGKKQMKTNGLEMGNERQGYGFGYDIGVFNPAGRSSAVTWDEDVRGDALAYVGRLHYDYGPMFHGEVAFGTSEQAGGFVDDPVTPEIEKSEDFEVFDLGLASELWDSGVELKLEYIDGTGIRGVEDRDQNCWSLMVGYLFSPNAEFVVKTYQAEHETAAGVKTDLGNTYVGFNIFPKRISDKHRDLQRHKLVINYILVNGDDVDSSTPWGGLGGYDDDAWAFQWQYKF